jgi:alkylresorcinol/alkylpyrone synthase
VAGWAADLSLLVTADAVRLLSVASASPPHVLDQAEARERARVLFGARTALFDRLAPVFDNSGIRTRRTAMPLEWYLQPQDWPSRSRAYLEAADVLFEEAAATALRRAGITGGEVDAVVTVSSTGIATPSLEARALRRLGFRADVKRTPVFGLGCAGGVSGLGLAARLARAEPGATVLLVVVELCTLAFRQDQLTKANIVATALFGDGAAACVLRAGEGAGWRIIGAAEHTWPGSLDIMGWSVDAQGFGVIFAQAIPRFVEAELHAAMTSLLERLGAGRERVGRFVCHPGGSKVIGALEAALDLSTGALDVEREVLAEFGNMSAPTALFVLERLLARTPEGPLVLTALGPGFTVSVLALEKGA